MSTGDMIFSGVFERYPKLQIGAVEFELSWVPHFLERMDFNYNERSARNEIYRFEPAFAQLVDRFVAEGQKPAAQQGNEADAE